jgi:hypothetical protein
MEKMPNKFSSPEIARELQRKYGEKTEVVKVQMRHERAVRRYIVGFEDAQKRAAKSKLVFH